ncbi:hypothetical protein [Haloterrigena salinisoli]|uniref:hypothetical protein n=1 Tax=Haloterrigena salinisoli TaxID=3132747 RepID=UPI0030CB5026
MGNQILSWLCRLVVGLGCFVGSLLAVATVAGAAIGRPKPARRRERRDRVPR